MITLKNEPWIWERIFLDLELRRRKILVVTEAHPMKYLNALISIHQTWWAALLNIDFKSKALLKILISLQITMNINDEKKLQHRRLQMGLRNHLVCLCHFTNEEPEVERDSLVCPWSYRVSNSAGIRLLVSCLLGQLWIFKFNPQNRIFLKHLIQFITHKIALFVKERLS